MLEIFDFLRGERIDLLTVTLRLVIALICGGCVGIERERKRRPAGFRTHILICLGAAMATLTGQYLSLELGLKTDVARLGAQVIAGVGFIGAGTIIVTKRRQVKGLTTAAGLWTAAIVGLCCGAGYVEGAILATVIIMAVELWLVKLEYVLGSTARACNIYVEYIDNAKLGEIVDCIKSTGAYINDMEVQKMANGTSHYSVVLTVRLPRRKTPQAIMALLSRLEGITSVEEL